MNSKDQQIKDLTALNNDLENYFRNTIIPQLFIDADLVLRKFTPVAMKQFELSPEDVGRSMHDVVNHFRFPSIIENIEQVIRTAAILEKEIQTTDLRWYQMNIIPYLEQADNRPNGVIITFVEITRRIKDLQDLEKLIADHETLLDTISHDIKNPVTNLLLSVELLNKRSSESPKNIKPVLKIIETGVKKLHRIITELTETRKGQQHKYEVTSELLNLEHVIEDVRLALLENIQRSDAVVKCHLTISEITFSRRKIRSIIYNLVNNAIKFSSPGRHPEILISTVREENFVVLTIQDNGMGIDPARYQDIFEKYYRIDNAAEGSGIGLHLVKELVTGEGGRILVESQIGHGTAFKIYLKAN